jgi:acetyltransferase-like isoleucine patch superfamily enzyme
MKETPLRGAIQRTLQALAKVLPGSSLRVALHRARGVRIGTGVWIGTEVILDTAYPWLITIEDNVNISVRAMILAHFRDVRGVKIERDAFIGAGALISPGVVIGHGAVVATGSVVTRSVAPMTMVQGNPAIPVARCGVALLGDVTLKEFSRHLKPLRLDLDSRSHRANKATM